MISSASCCNFAKHLLDPCTVQPLCRLETGPLQETVALGAQAWDAWCHSWHGKTRIAAQNFVWSTFSCLHPSIGGVLVMVRASDTGPRPPDSASSEADDQFLGRVTVDSGPVAGDSDTATTPLHSTRQPGDYHIICVCTLRNSLDHYQRICAAELDNFT